MPTQQEIDEILKFDPKKVKGQQPEEIDEIIKFDPGRLSQPAPEIIGGTYQRVPVTEPQIAADPLTGRTMPSAAGPEPGAPYQTAITGEYGEPEDTALMAGKVKEVYTPAKEPDAPIWAIVKSVYADDPKTKIQIFAEARGIPVERYRIGRTGEIEFRDDEGNWQREVSERSVSMLRKGVTEALAHPSTYTATAGAIVGRPAIGAMAGEIARKVIGKTVYKEKIKAKEDLFDITLEGIFALAGEKFAKNVVVGGINKYKNIRTGPIKRANIGPKALTEAEHARAEYLQQLARTFDMELAPHQLYDRASMTQMWLYLRKHPVTSDAIKQFDEAIDNAAPEALEGLVNDLMGSQRVTPHRFGVEAKEAATGIIDEKIAARKAAADPLYNRALSQERVVDIDRLIDERRINEQIIERITQKGLEKTPDVELIVSALKKQDIPTMRIKGEQQADYVERISRDYQRLVGKDVPTIKAETDVKKLTEIRQRNDAIERILAGEAPGEGVYLPTKPFKLDVTNAMDEVDRLMNETVKGDPSFTALNRIKMMLKNAEGNPRRLDRVKRSGIDNVLRKAKVDPTLRREMKLVKKQLTDAMDEQLPGYSKARATYEKMSKPIDRLKKSIIGEISELQNDKAIEAIPKRLLDPANVKSPNLIEDAKRYFTKQNPELWDEIVGEYIRDTAYNALKEAQSGEIINPAGKLRSALFGHQYKRNNLKAAMSPEKYQRFSDLMEVFQRAAGGHRGTSDTQSFLKIDEMFGTRVFKWATAPRQAAVDSIFGTWNDIVLHGRQRALLDALTSPDVVDQIKKIKRVPPKSARFYESVSVLTAMVGSKVGIGDISESMEKQKRSEQQ